MHNAVVDRVGPVVPLHIEEVYSGYLYVHVDSWYFPTQL